MDDAAERALAVARLPPDLMAPTRLFMAWSAILGSCFIPCRTLVRTPFPMAFPAALALVAAAEKLRMRALAACCAAAPMGWMAAAALRAAPANRRTAPTAALPERATPLSDPDTDSTPALALRAAPLAVMSAVPRATIAVLEVIATVISP